MLLIVLACSDKGESFPTETATDTADTGPVGDTGCSEADRVVDADDLDGDGYGDPTTARQVCPDAATGVENADDCDDANPLANPGAEETCNGVDDNCDNQRDEGLLVSLYVDADGDGFGDPATGLSSCPGAGLVEDATDCDDGCASCHPGGTEGVRDGLDQDCDAFDTGQRRVAAGAGHACAIWGEGDMRCWGWNDFGQGAVPMDGWVEVAAGTFNTCGLDPKGHLGCWGGTDSDLNETPTKIYTTLSLSSATACAIGASGDVDCWGQDIYQLLADEPGEAAIGVGMGWYHGCILREDGTAWCWGDQAHGEWDAPDDVLVAVSSGFQTSCGLTTSREITCWGSDDAHLLTAPSGEFYHVEVGYQHACGLRIDGSIVCWGTSVEGSTNPPTGTFGDISLGFDFGCARAADETVTCWGADTFGQLSVPNP
jgi:hypothetical protein